MFLLLKLYLAHLIGDFVLQVDELYQLKLKHAAGHWVHAFTHVLASLLILFPYLSDPFIWIFVVVISVVHLVQDLVKYRFMKHKRFFLHTFLADQAVHFLFLSAILFFPVSSQVRGFPNFPAFNLFYTENLWTVYSIAFLAATFCGSFTLNALSVTYLKNSRPDQFITRVEMIHGIIERGIIAGIFLFSSNPVVFALSPLAGALRLFSARTRSARDYSLSFIYASLVGLVFRLWLT